MGFTRFRTMASHDPAPTIAQLPTGNTFQLGISTIQRLSIQEVFSEEGGIKICKQWQFHPKHRLLAVAILDCTMLHDWDPLWLNLVRRSGVQKLYSSFSIIGGLVSGGGGGLRPTMPVSHLMLHSSVAGVTLLHCSISFNNKNISITPRAPQHRAPLAPSTGVFFKRKKLKTKVAGSAKNSQGGDYR